MRTISAIAVSALLLAPSPAFAQSAPERPAVPVQREQMRCASTQAEMATLQQDLGARFESRAESDRFVAYDDVANHRIWMFTTQAHPAHPSVACIEIVSSNGSIGAEVGITCLSSATQCANLHREFEARGARTRQAVSR